MDMPEPIAVYLEVAEKKTFACARDWPGWSRSGRTEVDALEALVACGPRYAEVAKRAHVRFRNPTGVDDLEIVERLDGGSGTEFGVPSATPKADEADLDARELERQRKLLEAAWATFDAAAKAATGVELRKGPRGGGRDLPKMTGHVHEAEAAYLHQLGSKPPKGADMATIRDRELVALSAIARGEEPPDPNKVRRPWTPRYFVRRSAWHALDHAWEIEDRAERE
jgi:hypothetical protein